MLCEMDMAVEIKEEPVYLEEIGNTSLEDYYLSEMTYLKEESKSELSEPGPSLKNTFEEHFKLDSTMECLKEETKPEWTKTGLTEPTAAIKDETIIEPTTVELVPRFKEENSSRMLS
ncbi:uncharacterized protein [Anabrus simplex]|uniref:uncharacterized protein isoform X4 n=1 Tax=Anabrus simplex TaxID=316456 RepID=UPI0035A3C4FA